MRHVTLLLVIVLLLCRCGSDDNSAELLEPSDLLPLDGEISGWQWDGSPASATDQASLYDLIDGGAEEFVERGFVSGVLHRYRGSLEGAAATVELFIADQGSQSNASDIYDQREERLLFAEELELTYAVDARIDEATSLDGIILDYWQQRFYVQVGIDNRQAAPELARQTVIQFAENVSLTIESGG
jgi:hypothetical protein